MYLTEFTSYYERAKYEQSYRIYPNQEGKMILKGDAFIDNNIEEVYKNLLGKYGFNIKAVLADKNCHVEVVREYSMKDVERIIEESVYRPQSRKKILTKVNEDSFEFFMDICSILPNKIE